MYNPCLVYSSSYYPVSICTSEQRQKQMFLEQSVEVKKSQVCLPLIKKKKKKKKEKTGI